MRFPSSRRYVVSDGRRVAMTESLVDAIAELAGFQPPAVVQTTADVGPETPTAAWPAAALDLLEEAESRLRSGDWQGFGEALAELRALLERFGAGAG